MAASPTRRGFVRLAVVRALLLGTDRAVACELFAVSDRRVRLWIHRFNDGGIDSHISMGGGGRPRKVPRGQARALLVPVLENPSLAGEGHWTARKIHGYLKAQIGAEIGYALKFPRPWAEGPGKDEAAREAFRERLTGLRDDPSARVWFCDETGVEGDPRPRRRWAAKGSGPKIPHHGGHLRRTVIGAVRPDGGEFFGMVWNACDTEVFQCFLDHLAAECPPQPGKRDVLIMDNASWHKVKSLRWHHFEPLYLPPYSPDLNPIERLWLRMKADHFADFYTRDSQTLEERALEALQALIADPAKVASNTAFR